MSLENDPFFPFGGRFELDSISDFPLETKVIQDYVDLFAAVTNSINKQKFKRPLSLKIEFINSSEINACVLRLSEGKFIIGIHVGTVIKLRCLMFLLCTGPAGFNPPRPWLPMCHSVNRTLRWLVSDYNSLTPVESLHRMHNEIYPYLEHSRQAIANALVMLEIAISYLVWHEIYHVLEGHVDYLQNRAKDQSIYLHEHSHFIGFQEHELMQGIEMAADLSAAKYIAASEPFAIIRDHSKFLYASIDGYYFLGASLKILFSIFSSTSRVVGFDIRDDRVSHPLPEVRLNLLFETILRSKYVKQRHDIEKVKRYVVAGYQNSVSALYSYAFKDLIITDAKEFIPDRYRTHCLSSGFAFGDYLQEKRVQANQRLGVALRTLHKWRYYY